MKKIREKPYIYWIICIFLLYLIANVLLTGFHQTLKNAIRYSDTFNWSELAFSSFLALVIGFLVAINSVYAYIRYKERKECRNAVAISGIGAVGGIVTGFCPLCIAGIVPLIFSLFGITLSFASLPLQGIEIQLLVIAILLISLKMLSKNRNI